MKEKLDVKLCPLFFCHDNTCICYNLCKSEYYLNGDTHKNSNYHQMAFGVSKRIAEALKTGEL